MARKPKMNSGGLVNRSARKNDIADRERRANELEAGTRGRAPGDRMRSATEDTANLMRSISQLQRGGLDLDNGTRQITGGERKMAKGGTVRRKRK
jgi:hypothetical protein